MSAVKFQYQRPSSPPPNTEIEVRSASGGGSGVVQGVYLDGPNYFQLTDSSGSVPAIVAGLNTCVLGLRVYGGPTDPVGDIPVTIDYPHHQIHEGESHQYTYAPCALSNGVSLDHLFAVPSLSPTIRTPHFVLEVDATAETWVYLYASPTTTASGTVKPSYNRNRNSGLTPSSSVFLEPAVSSTGSLLTAWIMGSGRSGGGTRESVEWDLKSDGIYLIRATAKATGDDVCIRFQWYEDLGV